MKNANANAVQLTVLKGVPNVKQENKLSNIKSSLKQKFQAIF